MIRSLGWLSLSAGMLLAGCTGADSSCSEDSDCRADAFCEPELNVCVTCQPGACAAIEQCFRGTCGARYSALTVVRPAPGGTISPTARFRAQLELVAGGERSDPLSVEYEVSNQAGREVGRGDLKLLQEGLYEGTWNAGEGERFTVVARYADADLVSAPVQFTIDRVPPVAELVVPVPKRRIGTIPPNATPAANEGDPALPGAWRRDEVVTIELRASEPLDLSATRLEVIGFPEGQAGPTKAFGPSAGCGQVFCATVAVDLAEPQMNLFRGPLSLRAVVADEAGNEVTATGSVPVTRWKWRFNTEGGRIETTPVLDSMGRVYFGKASGMSPGLVSLNPDGIQRWANQSGIISGSPVVKKSRAGMERVFYTKPGAANGFEIEALSVDGVPSGRPCPVIGIQAPLSGAISDVSSTGNTLDTFVTVLNGQSSTMLVAYRPEDITNNFCKTYSESIGPVEFPGNVVTSGGDYFFGDIQGRLQSFSYASDWTVRAGWPINTGFFIRSLLITGGDVVASLSGGPAQGGVGAYSRVDGQSAWSYPAGLVSSSPAWNPSVGIGNKIVFSREASQLDMVVLREAAALKTVATTTVRAAPLFGEGGRVYTANRDGVLRAYDAELNLIWSAEAVSLGTSFEASPTIDCARDSSGAAIPGRPGVLYVASLNGTLDAIVVDSRGIDTQAPWPKYQHDPRNSGNADTPLSEFACP